MTITVSTPALNVKIEEFTIQMQEVMHRFNILNQKMADAMTKEHAAAEVAYFLEWNGDTFQEAAVHAKLAEMWLNIIESVDDGYPEENVAADLHHEVMLAITKTPRQSTSPAANRNDAFETSFYRSLISGFHPIIKL